jgi:hypothetical protein
MKIDKSNYKLSWTRNTIKEDEKYNYWEGDYWCKLGVVRVYAQEDTFSDSGKGWYISLDKLVDGTIYTKQISEYPNRPTLKGLAILAGKFLREDLK